MNNTLNKRRITMKTESPQNNLKSHEDLPRFSICINVDAMY